MSGNEAMNECLRDLARRRSASARIAAVWCEVSQERETSDVKSRWDGGGKGGAYSVFTTEMYFTRWFLEDRGIV